VLDLSRVLAGPLCGQILGDHGASVIKVESPDGDETRRLGRPCADGSAPYFHGLNRNKRALVLDLSQAADRTTLHGLLAEADLLVENFLPGTLARWGLDFERDLQPRHPRLICCSISGFGATGPLGGLPGYDAIAQALGGIMSVNGEPASGPLRTGVPIVDISTGLNAVIGLLLALFERERSGLGQRVEVTLYDSALALLHPHAAEWLLAGREAGLTGSRHPSIAPYERFDALDAPIFIGVLNDRQFGRLCSVLGEPSLALEARFASNVSRLANRDDLHGSLQRLIGACQAQSLCDRLMREGVPAAPILSVAQALGHPHTRARSMILEDGDWRAVGIPVRLGRTPGALRNPAPPLPRPAGAGGAPDPARPK
jgi:crotonobetainyl-CoA:carnitine CoA-transferase CaiB-like acyl-CoA transferase